MTKKELNQKIVALNKAIDTLRSDMAAEFVKRDAQIEALRYVVAPIYKDIQDKVQEIREVVSELGKEDQDTEFGLFGSMDKAVADFDKACEDVVNKDTKRKQGRKREKPPKPGMAQVQTWIRRKEKTLKQFADTMRRLHITGRYSKYSRKTQYIWLTPEEAKIIDDNIE